MLYFNLFATIGVVLHNCKNNSTLNKNTCFTESQKGDREEENQRERERERVGERENQPESQRERQSEPQRENHREPERATEILSGSL